MDSLNAVGGARPFGAPTRLNVAVMAWRRAHMLRARSDHYLHTLYIVAIFYALPVLQLVANFQLVRTPEAHGQDLISPPNWDRTVA